MKQIKRPGDLAPSGVRSTYGEKPKTIEDYEQIFKHLSKLRQEYSATAH